MGDVSLRGTGPLRQRTLSKKGALRYHGTDAVRLGEVLRVRTISRLGVDIRVGVGPSITVAATASGQVAGPGGILAVTHDEAARWLGPLPVEALHGIGPRQAEEFGPASIRPAATLLRVS